MPKQIQELVNVTLIRMASFDMRERQEMFDLFETLKVTKDQVTKYLL